MSRYSDETRQAFYTSDRARDAHYTTPEDVVRYDNLAYGDDLGGFDAKEGCDFFLKGWQLLDLYRPKNKEGKKLPVIVSYHGGAFVYGSKEIYQYYCMSLAQRGFAVVNFNYRLAPEYHFPAALMDCNLVMKWIADHSEEYLLDVDNVYGVGDSAGGNGMGLYACLQTNPDYAKKLGIVPEKRITLRAVALNCGVYNPKEQFASDISREIPSVLFDHKGSEEELEWMDVLAHVTGHYPPTFVMTASGDFLKEEAYPMVNRLKECNVPYRFSLYGSEEHMLYHVFHCDAGNVDAAKCNDDECAFFMQWYQRELKTVLFDMDGVLLDTEKVYNLCWRKAAEEMGYDLNWERSLRIRSMNAVGGAELFEQWFGDASLYEKIRARRKELMAVYFANHPLERKKGAIETLQWLRANGYRTCLVTATEISLATEQLKKMELFDLLDELVSAKQVAHGKPNPDPYLFACEKMGVRPQDCYAIEDSENGIMSAYRAGCNAIIVPDLAEPMEEILPYLTATVSSLEELPALLLKKNM